MSDYKLVPKGIVDELAQFIRQVDGNNRMGAGALAEKICERFRVDAPAVQGEPVAWLSLCVKGDQKGQVEIDEPHAKATNPEYWTDAFPVYKTLKHAEQQPDVTRLVEALTELCDEVDNHDIHSAISKTNILWFKRKARAALAPYRKGGEV